jgi:hypothetical protein
LRDASHWQKQRHFPAFGIPIDVGVSTRRRGQAPLDALLADHLGYRIIDQILSDPL